MNPLKTWTAALGLILVIAPAAAGSLSVGRAFYAGHCARRRQSANRNYYGFNIWDENAPWYKRVFQAVRHLWGDQASPCRSLAPNMPPIFPASLPIGPLLDCLFLRSLGNYPTLLT